MNVHLNYTIFYSKLSIKDKAYFIVTFYRLFSIFFFFSCTQTNQDNFLIPKDVQNTRRRKQITRLNFRYEGGDEDVFI